MQILEIKEKENYIRLLHEGDISFGCEKRAAILGSCVSIILYSESQRIGGLSHINAVKRQGKFQGNLHLNNPFHFSYQVLDRFKLYQGEYYISDPTFYIFGGTKDTPYVYNDVISEFKKRKINYKIGDVLGSFHRYIVFEPENGIVKLLKWEKDSSRQSSAIKFPTFKKVLPIKFK